MALVTDQQIEDIQRKLKDFESDIETLTEELKSSTEKVKEVKEEIAEQNTEISILTTKKNKTVLSLQSNERIREKINEEIVQITKTIERLNKSIDEAKEKGDKELVEKLAKQKKANEALGDQKTKQSEDLKEKAQGLKEDIEKQETDLKEKIEANKLAKDIYDKTYKDKIENEKELARLIEEKNLLESSPLLVRYQVEAEARKEHARNSLRNKERIKPLLSDNNEDVREKLQELSVDGDIFIKDIKEELGIEDAGNKIIESVTKELTEEGTLFEAKAAFELSRKSLFDVSAVVEKIKAACSYGRTSLTLDLDDVAGTKLIILRNAGYKISHSNMTEGKSKKVIIDWGFAEEAPN